MPVAPLNTPADAFARRCLLERDNALAYAHALEMELLNLLGESAKRDERIRGRIAEARRKHRIGTNPPKLLREVTP